MRLLHRDDEDVRRDDSHTPDADDRTHRRSVFGLHRSTDRDAGSDRDGDGIADADERSHRRSIFGLTRKTEPDEHVARRDRDGDGVPDVDERRSREEIVERRKRWDTAGFLTAAYGAALAVMGALALVRAGVDESWYRPVVEVAGVDQSPLMGAIELGVGALVLITLLLGLRAIAAIVTFAAGVAAAVVAIEPSRVDADLALQRGWATALAIVSLALGLLLVATRDRRRERRVVRQPVTT